MIDPKKALLLLLIVTAVVTSTIAGYTLGLHVGRNEGRTEVRHEQYNRIIKQDSLLHRQTELLHKYMDKYYNISFDSK